MEYAIAVIDIGMTNKKVAVYDDRLRQLAAEYRSFPPRLVAGPGGGELETHDLEAMEAWFTARLAAFAPQYPIKALAVTTHGASFVCLDRDGKPAVPCVYYTHEPGGDFHERFYRQFGPAEQLQDLTGTPQFSAMINTAKGIFFAREAFPEGFARTVHLLMYPQYWGFRFTGKAGAEGTYMGCHTYLWDQRGKRLSPVAEGLGVAPLMPKTLNASWDVLGTISEDFARRTGLAKDAILTLGIHDSNSSLLPHFAKKGSTGFVLNSTGTWCVLMHPVEAYGFAPQELGKVVFFNISALGTPVKTAIFLGGQEFDTWLKLLMARHGRDDYPPYEPELYRTILREQRAFLLPELTAGSGQFPGSKPRVHEEGRDYAYAAIAAGQETPPCFGNYERGVAILRISLVMQTLTALERAGLEPGEEVFTEGGFRKNEAYNALLSAALPERRVFITNIPEATALGAAMTAKMALSKKPGGALTELAEDFTIDYHEVAKADIPELAGYRDTWLRFTEQH
ncbi:MAG: carbohydrate kinase [Treponema sp.]|jgi:sugar (pentulose or hexulose) kinase|nr:carbohydrate kinase [Treponema sp.]